MSDSDREGSIRCSSSSSTLDTVKGDAALGDLIDSLFGRSAYNLNTQAPWSLYRVDAGDNMDESALEAAPVQQQQQEEEEEEEEEVVVVEVVEQAIACGALPGLRFIAPSALHCCGSPLSSPHDLTPGFVATPFTGLGRCNDAGKAADHGARDDRMVDGDHMELSPAEIARALVVRQQVDRHRSTERQFPSDFCRLPIERGAGLDVYAAIARLRFPDEQLQIRNLASLLPQGFQRTIELAIASQDHAHGRIIIDLQEIFPPKVDPQHPTLSKMWLSTERASTNDRSHHLVIPMANGTAATLVYIHMQYNKDPYRWNKNHRFTLCVTLMANREDVVLAETGIVETYVYSRPRAWKDDVVPL